MTSATNDRTIAGRVRIASCFVAMLLLPAADRLAMVVEARGLHTVRAVDLLFLILGAVSFLLLLRTHGLPRLIRPSLYLAVVAAAILLLVVINTQTCFECGRSSFARPTTIFRGLALLVASHILFVTFTAEQRNRGVLVVAAVATVWVMTSMFLLINWTWAPFLLYGQTPYLHQPFSSPVQAANFAGVLLLLGLGAALTLNRPRLLYLLVPALTVAIAQAGSRSGMALLVASFGAFLTLYVGQYWLAERRGIPRNTIHLVGSALLAMAVIGILRTPEMSRSLTFLGLQPRHMATGGADEYRSRVWANVIDSWRQRSATPPEVTVTAATPVAAVAAQRPAEAQARAATPATPAVHMAAHVSPGSSGGPAAAEAPPVQLPPVAAASATSAAQGPSTPAASADGVDAAVVDAAVASPAPREAPHNVYLEFLVYGGMASMAGLIVVFTLLVGLTVHYAWEMRRSSAFPFASGLALAVLFVVAINYGNVTLHLSFVWVLFGLVTACASGALQSTTAKPEGVTAASLPASVSS